MSPGLTWSAGSKFYWPLVSFTFGIPCRRGLVWCPLGEVWSVYCGFSAGVLLVILAGELDLLDSISSGLE